MSPPPPTPTPTAPPPYPPSSTADSFTTQNGDVAQLTYDPLSPSTALAAVGDGSAGANVLFSGTTRDHFDSKRVTRLEYEAYTSLAIKTLRSIIESAHTSRPFSPSPPSSTQSRITRTYISHRLGAVEVGEPSILIAVSSPHRREAFVVAEWILEEVKRNVAIWKREVYEGGEVVVAPDGGGKGQGSGAVWKANFPPAAAAVDDGVVERGG